ncbi:alkaline phosphatase D [Sphaerotilus hippei]|uniref:Alkaline phosphatase D n=1 Tax=Sphaerotilus hippei TaxID=744406 RepID=A0A318H465_9BURK|nr:alkaline phosphatase D family protein [Sphaerotilus hippei]PXW95910.1 alkaline phosphatase D [Sphaerotilus hippei]
MTDPARHPDRDRRHWLAQAAGAGLGGLTGILLGGCAPAAPRGPRSSGADRFALGIASGSPQADRVVLWTRLSGPDLAEVVDVQWELALDEGFRQLAARGTEQARAADAHSVHAEPAGLAPGRWYWYRFTALGERSAVGRTRTHPAPGTAPPLRCAIASCQRWDHGHYAAWRHLAQAADRAGGELDLVLFLGDYIYEYGGFPGRVRQHTGGLCRTLDDYRARYALYKSDASLQAAHACCPWVTVWDDHEVDNDYAGLQEQWLNVDFAARRAAAYRAYWEHMPFPKSARPGRDGGMRIFGHGDWGSLARILTVDDRQYRDPQACPRPPRAGSTTVATRDCATLDDPRRSLLGADQEAWLARHWSSTHRWNLLAQQTLMAPMNWNDPASPEGPKVWTDGWDGYPQARRRLLDTLAQRHIPGAVVLGGDVHANYVADLHLDPARPDSPIVASEFCGTSISSEGMAQSRLDAMRPHHPHLHHGRSDERGYVRLEFGPDTLQATLLKVQHPRRPDSAVGISARFAVDARQPGILPP